MKKNIIYNEDCILGMAKNIEDASIDCILTDPPYKYLKNQKLEVDFNEVEFFNQAKRVLKKDGFIVLFGRGTSFYRWNTILADMGFTFKEEIVWDKSHCSSPLMNISRIHETISIFTKGKGTINKVKVPYLEMKKSDINSIIQDIKRLKSVLKNTRSLDAVLEYLKTNKIEKYDIQSANNVTVSSSIIKADRSVTVVNSIEKGMNEKTIIRAGYNFSSKRSKHNVTLDNNSTGSVDRAASVVNSIEKGMNEKTIIKQVNNHFKAVHPTQKPVRLMERLLALTTKEGMVVLDPFSGSGSTAKACVNMNRYYIAYEIDKEYYELSVRRINA